MGWSVVLQLIALMIAPLVLGITALTVALRWRLVRSRWVLLALLVPQTLIALLLLWPAGLKAVAFSQEVLFWLVTLVAWLVLLLARFQQRDVPPIPALVSGWVLFIVFTAAVWFYPANQQQMSWKRYENQMQQNLVLLEQGATARLDTLPDNVARELFYRAMTKRYSEQTLRYFIRRGLSPLDKGDAGFTPFSQAIESYNVVALKLFLSVLTPAQIQSLSFDYDPLRNLRLEPPSGPTAQQQFYASMTLLLAARPDWIQPRNRQTPSYMTTALFNGITENVNFLQAYLPAPTGLWRIAQLALQDDTRTLIAALRSQPRQLEQSLSDGAGRSLSLMAWMIKYAPPATRKALLNSGMIRWDRFLVPVGEKGQEEMTNTLIDEARGNWRYRDESPGVLEQVLTAAIQQKATLPAGQMLAVFRYSDSPEILHAMLDAGLPCGPLMAASAQRLSDSRQDAQARSWISEACLHRN